MKLKPDQIKQKWEIKLRELIYSRQNQTKRKLAELRTKLWERLEAEYDKQMTKLYKKDNAYIRKKEQEYKRKCNNEIRKSQGKEEKEYKQQPLPRNKKLQIALAIAQENSKLRDTNEDGYWYCITCKRWCSWEELAGWHGYSRTIQGVCLRESNINAQCHNCNWIMWPKGNTLEKEKTALNYRENARDKRWDDEIDMLQEMAKKSIKDPVKYAPSSDYICDIIPELIRRNEELRKKKSPEFKATHKPAKNRRKLREKYFTPKERGIWE